MHGKITHAQEGQFSGGASVLSIAVVVLLLRRCCCRRVEVWCSVSPLVYEDSSEVMRSFWGLVRRIGILFLDSLGG